MSIRDWLARLAFSFLIVGFALLWTGHQRRQAGQMPAAITFSLLGVVAMTTGFIGVRLRHAPR